MNRHASLPILLALPLFLASGLKADGPLKVCATLPDLGRFAEQVGGDQVRVTVFVKGPQDAHFMEARPSFIKELNAADLLLISGLDLEIGWAPNLWANARNPRVLPGAGGHLNVSSAITPKEIPAGVIDRSMGDVHPLGNPHYLLDPVNGLKAARAIRDKLVELRPESRDEFSKRHGDFAKKLQEALVGEKLAAKYDAEKLALLHEHGKLEDFLKSQGELDLLGGWVRRLAAFRGVEVIADHNLWPYFADRFGIKVVGFLEPKPGIAPSTSHLSQLVKDMKRRGVRAILTVPYFDRRHAAFLSQNTGAKVVSLAHQCGSQPGTDDYIAMVDHNVRQLESALRPAASPPEKP